MRILIVTYFYSPDIRPGAFRSAGLVRALREMGGGDCEIDVITTIPQRGGVESPVPTQETAAGVTIYRIALPLSQGGIAVQAMAFTRFFFGALGIVHRRHYDVVVATSGRLMTGVLGSWIARRQSAPFFLDLRDIFVENINEMLPRAVAVTCGWIFSALERWTINHASRVNLVSAGFAPWFTSRYPRQQFTYLTHGIDEEFCLYKKVDATSDNRGPNEGPLRVLYAGNLGDGQGLHRIVPELARRLGKRVRFRIIGDGNCRGQLVDALRATGENTVDIIPPVSRSRMLDEYRAADVLFVHLNSYAAFQRVLPSKLFEYGATGKPIWAGVAGYPAEFVRTELSNVAIFPPCDVDAAMTAFAQLELGECPRVGFVEKYSRSSISRAMAEQIIGLLPVIGTTQ